MQSSVENGASYRVAWDKSRHLMKIFRLQLYLLLLCSAWSVVGVFFRGGVGVTRHIISVKVNIQKILESGCLSGKHFL